MRRYDPRVGHVAQPKSQGLLHGRINAKKSKCKTTSEEITILGLVGRTQPESLELLHTAFLFLKYAAEQGLYPQANFANQPESQGLLGSAILCFPSGASQVLDRHAP